MKKKKKKIVSRNKKQDTKIAKRKVKTKKKLEKHKQDNPSGQKVSQGGVRFVASGKKRNGGKIRMSIRFTR